MSFLRRKKADKEQCVHVEKSMYLVRSQSGLCQAVEREHPGLGKTVPLSLVEQYPSMVTIGLKDDGSGAAIHAVPLTTIRTVLTEQGDI